MKATFKSLFAFAATAILLLSAIPAFAAQKPSSIPPPDDVALWIEPVEINLTTANPEHTIGYKFNVTVWGKSNVEFKGWQIWLRFDGNLLNTTYTRVWYVMSDGSVSTSGPSELMQGVTTMPVTPSVKYWYDGNYHRIDFGEGWLMGGYAQPTTAARACKIEFEVVSVPEKGIIPLETWLDISYHANPTDKGTYILLADGTYALTAYDAIYAFEWAPPPSPGLTVDPSTRFFDRYTEWNGTTFTETVKLTDLAAAWYLTNVSFTLNFDPNELAIIDIVKNTADWDVALDVDNTTTPGQVVVYAETSQQLSGDIDIITITFKILDQEVYPAVDVLSLAFTGVKAFDHTLEIIVDPIVDGEVTVEGFLAVAMPWMEVKPKDSILGPEFVKHTTFQVEITINRLHYAWKLVGVEFRLLYDDTLLEVVDVEEGPYLSNWAPYGTWFQSYVEPNYYGPHILVGNLILPNGTGEWNPPFPGDDEGGAMENGTIAIITFEILEQLPGDGPLAGNLTCTLELFNIRMVDPEASLIPVDLDRVVNGTVTILGYEFGGRFIDVYGGANNAGYGSIPFPAPFGGQGLGRPMDLVIPQSEVTLFADVLYNYWPVQQKDVNFEVEGPYDHVNGEFIPKQNWFILLKETARTDENGVANISFAMPWPCIDPESLLGVWKVTATVNIRDVVVVDVLYFYYDYMVHIWKVTTDKEYYYHSETVEITIEYGSHAMLTYPGLFSAIIKDELNVVIGIDLAEVTLGGAEFCTFANGTIKLYIHIEKWAFTGYADIYVNCYDKDPTEGGFAWTPQALEEDIIYILPN